MAVERCCNPKGPAGPALSRLVKLLPHHLACGWAAMYSMASLVDRILSASLSGISTANSSSKAMTTLQGQSSTSKQTPQAALEVAKWLWPDWAKLGGSRKSLT